MPLFSTRLWAGQATTTTQVAFTVPSGKRIVIRFVYLIHNAAGGLGVIVYLSSPLTELFRALPNPATSPQGFDVRLTLHEGESCSVRALGAQATASLNGFILDGAGGPLTTGAQTKPA